MVAAEQPVLERYAIRAERVFDGRGFRGASNLVVESGRIVAVDDAQPLASDLPVVELEPGATLLPGLIDTHVHLVFDASWQAAVNVQQISDNELVRDVRDRLRVTLEAGITTARDLGDRRYLTLPLRDELAGDLAAGPELLCAGPPITTPRGHCWFLGGEVASEGDLAAAVTERARRGVDAVKVMATGGEMTEGSHAGIVQFSEDALRAIVDAARRHALPVAAHAHSRFGIANALAAGVDAIEHCSFMTEDDVEVDLDLVAAIAAAGTIVSLTLGFVPGDIPPPPKIRAVLAKIPDTIRRMRSAGVVITLGSDAGIAPVKPHGVLPYGVVALADLTGDNAEALAAATSIAARACGLADRKGTLAPGYDADLVAVTGDPAADIRVVHDVAGVYRSGVAVAGARSVPANPRVMA